MLLNNEFISDIKFQFPDGQIMHAHSFVLCMRSSKFYDSFKTSIGITKLIPIDDVSYNAFFTFMQYLYTDKCEIDVDIAEDLLKLAKEYFVYTLERKCSGIMTSDVSVDKACKILEVAMDRNMDYIQQDTLEFIAENYLAVMSDESFLEIKKETLNAILKLDHVSNVDEYKIFELILKWTDRACIKDGLQPNGSTRRAQLGENMKLIRFGSMTAKEFGQCQEMAPGLFNHHEISEVFINIATKKLNSLGFSDVKRTYLKPKVDLQRLQRSDCALFADINYREFDFPASAEYSMELSISKEIKLSEAYVLGFSKGKIQIRIESDEGETIYTTIQPFQKGTAQLYDRIPLDALLLEANRRYTLFYKFINSRHLHHVRGCQYNTSFPVEVKSASKNVKFTYYKLCPHILQINFKH